MNNRKRILKEVGAWNKLPHYAIVGQPQDFYVWVNDGGTCCSSNWIKGNEAFRLYHELTRIKDKDEFVKRIKVILIEHGKSSLYN